MVTVESGNRSTPMAMGDINWRLATSNCGRRVCVGYGVVEWSMSASVSRISMWVAPLSGMSVAADSR